MKYNIILTNEEIEKIFKMEKETTTFGELIKKLENEFENFDIKNSKKYSFILNWVVGVSGHIEKNSKDMICPNCSGKYVVRTYAGDLFYRLYNGSNRQKEKEKRKFENMGLFCNPWATDGDDVRDFICLNCATRWNKKNEKIVNDQL